MTMVQQNFHFSTQAQYPSLGFVTAQEIQNTTNDKKQEAVTTACTRGYDIFAKFCCRQSKLLESISRIFSALHCG